MTGNHSNSNIHKATEGKEPGNVSSNLNVATASTAAATAATTADDIHNANHQRSTAAEPTTTPVPDICKIISNEGVTALEIRADMLSKKEVISNIPAMLSKEDLNLNAAADDDTDNDNPHPKHKNSIGDLDAI